MGGVPPRRWFEHEWEEVDGWMITGGDSVSRRDEARREWAARTQAARAAAVPAAPAAVPEPVGEPEPPFVPLDDWDRGELLDKLKVWNMVVLSFSLYSLF